MVPKGGKHHCCCHMCSWRAHEVPSLLWNQPADRLKSHTSIRCLLLRPRVARASHPFRIAWDYSRLYHYWMWIFSKWFPVLCNDGLILRNSRCHDDGVGDWNDWLFANRRWLTRQLVYPLNNHRLTKKLTHVRNRSWDGLRISSRPPCPLGQPTSHGPSS